MADEIRRGNEMYATVCKALDELDWTYDRDDEKLTVTTGVQGDDLPIRIIIRVLAEGETVSVLSPLGFYMAEDMRVDGAIAVSVANYGLIRGSFDYDITDGEIRFRVTAPYNDSTLSTEVIKFLIYITTDTVDNYNDKFFMISKGMLSVQDFIKQEKSEN